MAAAVRFAQAWEAADPALRKALATAQATTAASLARLTDGTWEDAVEAARELAGGAGPRAAGAGVGAEDVKAAQWAGEVQVLQDAAARASAAEGASFARRPPEELAAAYEVLALSGRSSLEVAAREESSKRMLSYVPPPPAVKRRRLRADEEAEEGGTEDARARAEAARRGRQVAVLAELLREAAAPVIALAEGSAHLSTRHVQS